MKNANFPDLNLTGIGTAAGGDYRSVRIEGVGKVDGDLSCETFHVDGVATVTGTVRAQRFKVHGTMNGAGSLFSPEVVVEGEVKMRGFLNGDSIKLEGIMKLHGDCEAERFEARGGFTIDGLLNAGSIDVQMYGRCQAREIGGENIRIQKSDRKSWTRLFKWMIPAFDPGLTAEIIEGDDILLEEANAVIVRGNRVTIGPGCKIDRVEYRSELIVHPDAKVKQRVQG